ncbi:unnamed protein product [Rodentolepis nana]|uniref:Uncharacterized protein n=1 Tax=Rodentolepis nana TaxID=102285 RepID=A0A0R3T164_RODNA|nr:unnamed protein product [Rodentolepis nana]
MFPYDLVDSSRGSVSKVEGRATVNPEIRRCEREVSKKTRISSNKSSVTRHSAPVAMEESEHSSGGDKRESDSSGTDSTIACVEEPNAKEDEG